MARWILGYLLFVLGIFWIGWDIVGPGLLLWSLGIICSLCTLAGGFLWWQDERRWRQEIHSASSSTKEVGARGWSTARSSRTV